MSSDWDPRCIAAAAGRGAAAAAAGEEESRLERSDRVEEPMTELEGWVGRVEMVVR